jgi:hypothetical protein
MEHQNIQLLAVVNTAPHPIFETRDLTQDIDKVSFSLRTHTLQPLPICLWSCSFRTPQVSIYPIITDHITDYSSNAHSDAPDDV